MSCYEVEQKFILKNPKILRSKLRKLKARKILKGGEKNELWDRRGEMASRQSVLRLRLSGRAGTLTVKGPRLKSRFKKRIEIETPVQYVAMRKVLIFLGYRVHASYEKYREEYQLGNAYITIDHLKGLGWFTEIEASSKIISTLARRLGFSDKDREERSYLEMIYGNRSRWAGK